MPKRRDATFPTDEKGLIRELGRVHEAQDKLTLKHNVKMKELQEREKRVKDELQKLWGKGVKEAA